MNTHQTYRASLLAAAALAANMAAFAQAPAIDPFSLPSTSARVLRESRGAARPNDSGPLIYHGGTLLTSPKLVTVFWGGSMWNSSKPLLYHLADFDKFVQTALDPLMLLMDTQYSTSNYHIGVGTENSVYENNSPLLLPWVPDSYIQSSLTSMIKSGEVGYPDANTLYVIYTPPGVCGILGNQHTCGGGVCAWHNVTSDPAINSGNSIYYAFVPDAPSSGCRHGLAEQDSITQAASHEVMEATTDPLGTGWTTQQGNEIGDLCNGQGFNYPDLLTGKSFRLQEMFSNKSLSCVE
jgi:hypothetical protein